MCPEVIESEWLNFPEYFDIKVSLAIRVKVEHICEWVKKSNEDNDPFDKFISLFIAFNMFYNLYALYKDPYTDLEHGDRDKALSTLELLDKTAFFNQHRDQLSSLGLECEKFTVEVRTNRKKENVSMRLSELVNKNKKKDATDLALKILYSIRCNLVHGEKGRDEPQKELLETATALLKVYLVDMLSSFKKKLIKKE